MEVLVFYAAVAVTLAWTGHALTRKRKRSIPSGKKRTFRVLLAVLLVGAGLWFTDIVTYRMWAAGGLHPLHKATQVYWIVGGLAVACATCFTAGIAWPRRMRAKNPLTDVADGKGAG